MNAATANEAACGRRVREWRQRRGMSQLALAIRAATSQRHVSFIEQGRSQPSRSMLIRLAESLEIPLRERNALLLDAGFAPIYSESDLDGPALRPAWDALTHVLAAYEPWPAVVMRPNGDIVSHNAATAILFEGVDPDLLISPLNAYRIALHPHGMAPRIKNFDEWAFHVIIGIRSQFQRNPSDAIAALLAELESFVPRPIPGTGHLGFAVPVQLSSSQGELTLVTTITTFATATDVTLSELRLEAFLPADQATADALVTARPNKLE